MENNNLEKNDDMTMILDGCFFSSKYIISATLENLREVNKSCEFLGYDFNSIPVLSIDGSMYYLIYNGSTCGVQGELVLQTITLKKAEREVKINSEDKKHKGFFSHFKKAN